jgi:hypothetical protein
VREATAEEGVGGGCCQGCAIRREKRKEPLQQTQQPSLRPHATASQTGVPPGVCCAPRLTHFEGSCPQESAPRGWGGPICQAQT